MTKITTIQKILAHAIFEKLKDDGLWEGIEIEGPARWESSDTSVVTVEDGPDSLSAWLVSGLPGIALVTVTGDAEFGEGLTPVTLVFEVEVTQAAEFRVRVVFDNPVTK